MKIGSLTASIPNPTPLLFLITAAAIVLWPDAMGITAIAVTAAILLPLAAMWLAESPGVAIAALVVASAAPRLYLEIAGLKARPEHIIGGILCISVLFIWKARRMPVRWMAPDYWLAAYAGLNIFSSLFTSQAPMQTIKWAVQQVLVIFAYFLLRVLIEDQARFRKAFAVLLVTGAITVGYGVFCFYLNLLFGSEFGVTIGQYGDIPATYGLQYEANLLGSYSGALCMLMLVMYLFEGRRRYLIGYAVALAALAISLSRGAVGATLVGFLAVLLFSRRKRLVTRKSVSALAIATMCALVVVLPVVFQHYSERFSTVDIADPTADPDTLTRVVTATSAVDEVLKHPILGGGTSSFQLVFDSELLGADPGQGWIGNTELRVLHDTGLVGLAVFVGFLVSLVRNSRKLLKQETNPYLIALLAAALVYSVSFQATEGTLLAFFWVHVGLIGCAIAVSSVSDRAIGKGLAKPASG
jgi:O-Antigen ligase